MIKIINKSAHLLIILLAHFLINTSIFAQAPQKMSYQAVIRNSNDSLLISTPVGMRISLVQGTPTGIVVFSETQTATTNANGLVSLQIGMGTALSGTFANIDWSAGPYYVKIETDLSGGTNYTIISSNEILSVPYALFSANGTPGPAGPIGLTGETGTTGQNGLNALIKTTSEAAGANCANGGTKIETGLDANGNGVLDGGEVIISLTRFVCNGSNGSSLTTLASLHTIYVGTNYFSPEYLKVNVGDTVRFIWVSGIHSTTSVATSGNDSWNVILSSSNQQYQEVINNPGNHPFSDQVSGITGLITTLDNGLTPPGTITAFAGNTIPVGWKICDGSAISRTSYDGLFTAIGIKWGQGDGSSTFNLPDLRGRFLRGVDGSAGNDPDANARTALYIGGNIGNNVGSYQSDELKAHKHNYNGWYGPSGNPATGTGGNGNTTSISIESTSTGGTETRPKNAYVIYIIKL